jgi:hypothetical protein
MEGITPFQSGRPLLSEITADKLNRILAEIKRNRPVVAAPLSARVTGDGTCISLLKQPVGASGTPPTRQPWDLIAFPDAESEAENPPYKIRVVPGTLNSFLPANWDTEFNAAPTGLHYAKAVIATDGEAITGVTIAIDTTPPIDQDPQEFAIPATVEYLFGLFAEGNVYRVIGAGSISLLPRQWFVLGSDPAAAPGELPYDIYYALAP